LITAFHGTRSGHHDQLFVAYRHTIDRDDGVLRVKLATGQFKGPQDRHRSLDAIHPFDWLAIQWTSISNDANDGALFALRDVCPASQLLDASGDVDDLSIGRTLFHDHDHVIISFWFTLTS
jgi:hypothetical protein